MRTVKVYLSRTGVLNEFQTNATTWGDFKKELEDLGYFSGNMKAIHMKTKVTLEHPEVQLPSDDSYIILVPTDSKAGSEDYIMSPEEYKKLVNELVDVVQNFMKEKETILINNTERERLHKEVKKVLEGFNKA